MFAIIDIKFPNMFLKIFYYNFSSYGKCIPGHGFWEFWEDSVR